MRRLFRSLFTSRTARPATSRPSRVSHKLRQSPRVQILEERAVPTATLVNTPGLNVAGGTSYSFDVKYSNTVGYDSGSFGGTDVKLGTSTIPINLVSVNNSDPLNVIVTYSFSPPDGVFDAATDNSAYAVNVQANEVFDSNTVAEPAGNAGTFYVYIPTLANANVTTSGGASAQFKVTYTTGPDNYKASSFDNSDITVTGPNGFSGNATFVSVDVPGDGKPRTVTYQIAAPGGTFNATNRGRYTVNLNANQVTDINSVSLTAQPVGTFLVAFGPYSVSKTNDVDDGNFATGQISLREAALMVNAVSSADTTSFVSTITFDTAVFNTNNTITLDASQGELTFNANVTVNGPGVSKLTVDGGGNTRVFGFYNNVGRGTATTAFARSYAIQDMTITGGNGDFDGPATVGLGGDGGAITMNPDSNLYPSPTTSLSLTRVAVTNSFTPTQGGGVAIGRNQTLNVTDSTLSGNSAQTGGGAYLGNQGVLSILRSTVSGNTVSNGQGGGGLYFFGGTGVSAANDKFSLIDSTVDGNTSDAGGGAIALLEFKGTVAIQNSTITDNKTSNINGGGGIFIDSTSVAATITIDSSVISSDTNSVNSGQDYYDIYDKGAATSITINRSFLSRRNVGFSGTLDAKTLAISGTEAAPGDPQLATLANNGGPTLTRLPTNPGPLIDNGSNVGGLLTDQRGQARNFGTPDIGAVEIIVAGQPTATAQTTAITKSGGSTYSFNVIYQDDTGIKRSTLGTGDVIVTGPLGYSQVATFVSADTGSDSTKITATYSITANNGAPGSANWDFFDNGTYNVDIQSGQVTDIASPTPNAIKAGTSGTFSVAAPAPAANVTIGSPANGASSMTFTIKYVGANTPISFASLGADDVRVTGPSGFDQAAAFVSAVPGSDSTSIVATYSITAPGGSFNVASRGLYNVNVQYGKVLDVDGTPVGASLTPPASTTVAKFAAGLIVDEISDTDDSITTAGALSLREAVGIANQAVSSTSSITFDPTVFAGSNTIFMNGQLAPATNVSIVGPGESKLTLDEQGGNRHFFVEVLTGTMTFGLSDITLTNGFDSTGDYGGSIFANNAAVTISRATIKNSQAGLGGAIYPTGVSSLTGTSVTFSGNTAFYPTGATSILGGGAITVLAGGVNVSFTSCNFLNNSATTPSTATSPSGGAIEFISTGDFSLVNCTFSGNFADNRAGALYLRGGSVTSVRNISGCTFSSNTAGLSIGGAIVDNNTSQVKFTNTQFINNSAASTGGAMFNFSGNASTSLTIDSCTFTNNTSAASGGAVGGQAVEPITVKNSTFTGNLSKSTTGGGGALRFISSTLPLVIQDSTFSGNITLGRGGAVYMGESAPTTILRVNFNANQAQGSSTASTMGGGAFVHVGGTATATLTVQDSTITNNVATNAGGGFLVNDASPVVITGTKVTGNTASASFGGGFGALTNGGISISNSDISNNKATLGGGGGAQLQSTALISVTGTSVSNNVAVGSGGLFVGGGDTTSVRTFTDDTISGNQSNGSGGGILFNEPSASVTINRSSFTNNSATLATATSGGAAINFQGATSITQTRVVDNSVFSGNVSAKGSGGAITIIGSGALTIRNSTVGNNTATAGDGGGISVGNAGNAFTGTVTIKNSTVARNTAATTGGGIGTGTGGTITIVSSIVSDNNTNSNTLGDIKSGTTITENNSLIGKADGVTLAGGSGSNLNGTIALPQASGLDTVLAANGNSKLPTFKLLAGSAALNTGSNPDTVAFDQRGTGFDRTKGSGTDMGAYEEQVTATPPTLVGAVVLNGGQPGIAGQHSMIRNITLTFSEAVTIGAGAFTLTHNAASFGGVVGDVGTINVAQSGATVTLTFDGAFTEANASAFGKSLANGFYDLKIDATKVSGAGGQLDGNGNGTGGDNFTITSAKAGSTGSTAGQPNLFRMFGDANGDQLVDLTDFVTFRGTYGSTTPPNLFTFDNNGDGAIDLADYVKFRANYGGAP